MRAFPAKGALCGNGTERIAELNQHRSEKRDLACRESPGDRVGERRDRRSQFGSVHCFHLFTGYAAGVGNASADMCFAFRVAEYRRTPALAPSADFSENAFLWLHFCAPYDIMETETDRFEVLLFTRSDFTNFMSLDPQNPGRNTMKEECLICKAPLTYLHEDTLMECAICHKKEYSKTRCVSGHYVCNECHTAGIDAIFGVCLAERSKNPIAILNRLMALPFCHMHGPEHHIMVGAALLTAYKNAGGEIDLEKALAEMRSRGGRVPGGACGFWGACGAGVSTGMFLSIITGSTPLAGEPFGLSNRMTARALNAIGEVGGPRCCKRDSYLSVIQAVAFVKETLGMEMETGDVVCGFSGQNNQCIGKRCPFSGANR